jgi:hypothetical protein
MNRYTPGYMFTPSAKGEPAGMHHERVELDMRAD